MAVPTPMTFVSGDQASAAFIAGIHDPLAFLLTSGPMCIARVTTPVVLTPEAFTPLTFDTVTYDTGGFMSGGTPIAPENGIYIAGASIRCDPARGNKELRVAVNGGFGDSDPWLAVINQFGVATAAFSSLAAMGMSKLTAGDSIDVGVYVDAPTTVSVINAVVYAVWVRAGT